ncbi:TetR family transcriptional regulator [Actinocorallia sp. A-T 12471]|uniref:TetR family transcriptional regulator n=1 Tax=Actinocorallia sp. A-T 12471 TaxID=3089813 RepID=UPI0029D3ECCF|nr:TetR family transcriptional regulator [Actinocorallia sp. A-T 12471]MDX6739187.1 TetR family transcriptional regulator [Actinocorallia sp. A-T 12471]
MSGAVRTSTRDIARAAVRAELAEVAFDLFARDGFDNVTITEVAEAAGVSRSTFLRYFDSKEDAVLGALDAQGMAVADALRERPASEDDWTALRNALATLIEPYASDPERTLALTRLVRDTPSLRARQLERQHAWRPLLAEALAQRARARSPRLRDAVRAAAALTCLNAAVEAWTGGADGRDLRALLDEAFASLTVPRRPR